MAVLQIISNADASLDSFTVVKMVNEPFSIDAKFSTIVGSPTWTLMVSNVGVLEADFKPYRSDTTNMTMITSIQKASFNFEYLAIKYTPNGATGTYSFYMGKI